MGEKEHMWGEVEVMSRWGDGGKGEVRECRSGRRRVGDVTEWNVMSTLGSREGEGCMRA